MVIDTSPAGSIDEHDASIHYMLEHMKKNYKDQRTIKSIGVQTIVPVQMPCWLALQLSLLPDFPVIFACTAQSAV
jgi:hypothetical protein